MRIYVSCPLTVPKVHLDKVLIALKGRGHAVIHWDRNEEYGQKHTDAIIYGEAVVVILPDNSFKKDWGNVSNGVRSEIRLAMRSNTEIFLAYHNSYKGLDFYTTEIVEDDYISGLLGTTNNPVSKVKKVTSESLDMKAVEEAVSCVKSVANTDNVSNPVEKRLLLLK